MWMWAVPIVAWLVSLFTLVLFIYRWHTPLKEVIEVTRDIIVLKYQGALFPPTRKYAMAYISNLRTTPNGGGSGSLLFDYGASTVRFGWEVDEAEAKVILTAIQTSLSHNRVSS